MITYTANDTQKIAVASGFTMLAWPTKIVTAKITFAVTGSASWALLRVATGSGSYVWSGRKLHSGSTIVACAANPSFG